MYQHFGRATEEYGRLRSAGVMGLEEYYLFSSTSVGFRPMPDAVPALRPKRACFSVVWLVAGDATLREYQHFTHAAEWYMRRRSAGVMGLEEFYLFSSDSVGSRPMLDAVPALCFPGGRVFQWTGGPRRAPHVSALRSRHRMVHASAQRRRDGYGGVLAFFQQQRGLHADAGCGAPSAP